MLLIGILFIIFKLQEFIKSTVILTKEKLTAKAKRKRSSNY